jgi:hypothetical protein
MVRAAMLQTEISFPDLPGLGVGWELLLPHAEAVRRCTGAVAAGFEEKRRQVVRACVHLGTRRVAEAFGVSREVVRALRSAAIESGELDQFKEEEARQCFSTADRLLDRLKDEVDNLPLASVPVAYGILTDKALLLSGAPTAIHRLEHVVTVEDAAELIAALPVVAEPVWAGKEEGQKAIELRATCGDVHGIPVELLSQAELRERADSGRDMLGREAVKTEAEKGN